MFDENENIYPVKPEILVGSSNKNRIVFFVLALLLAFAVMNFYSETYILLIEVLLVLILHEFGHFMMMRIYKVRAQGMFFMSFLTGLTRKFDLSDSQKQHVFINLMGPLPGILIGIGLFTAVIFSEPNIYLIEIALLLLGVNLLNLLPLDPFDGGRILEGFFFYKNDQRKMYFTLFSSLTMIVIGVVYWFVPLIVIGFLMGLKVRGYQKSNELHEQLEETNIDYKKEYQDLTNREYWKIRSVFLLNNPRWKEMIPSGYTLWENERLLVEQVKQLLRIDVKPDMPLISKVMVLFTMLALIVVPVLLILTNYDLVEWYIEHASF